MRLALFATLILATLACAPQPEPVECRNRTDCDLEAGGTCVIYQSSGKKWCQYPDSTCQGTGIRWSDFDTGDGLSGECVSVGFDGGVDSGAASMFDVGFVNGFEVGTSATSLSYNAWVRVINMGSEPLDLSTAQIENVTAGLAGSTAMMNWTLAVPVNLDPGFSGGFLVPDASALIVGSGLVTEPGQDIANAYVSMEITLPPAGWLILPIEGTLRIGDARLILTLNITATGGGTAVRPVSAGRVSSSPI